MNFYERLKVIGDDGICFSTNRYLSRYQAIGEDLNSSLRNCYLWFSDPLAFNDPYDCNLETGIECTFYEICEYVLEENLRQGRNVDYKSIHKTAKDLFCNPQERKARSKTGDLITVGNMGVCRFSERNDLLLMWSHYGQKHQGVCLTFDIKGDRDFFKRFYAVEYPEKYPIHNWPRDRGKFHSYRFLIATKSKDWEYENEIRVVRNSKNSPFRERVEFNPSALAAVHFGYKCSENNISEIKTLLDGKECYKDVRLFQAELKEQTFGITYRELK